MPLPSFNATPHEFGQPIEQKISLDTVEWLFNRRSASAPLLKSPGPNESEMDLLITIGFRVPDHGKIGPWRIVRFTRENKALLVDRLSVVAGQQDDPKKALGALQKLALPPEALMVVSSPIQPNKIPLWEQQLSAAAICQTLLIAAGAMGFGANWITDWYSYDPEATRLLGLGAQERVAGFIFLGTQTEPPLERERPDIKPRISWWSA